MTWVRIATAEGGHGRILTVEQQVVTLHLPYLTHLRIRRKRWRLVVDGRSEGVYRTQAELDQAVERLLPEGSGLDFGEGQRAPYRWKVGARSEYGIPGVRVVAAVVLGSQLAVQAIRGSFARGVVIVALGVGILPVIALWFSRSIRVDERGVVDRHRLWRRRFPWSGLSRVVVCERDGAHYLAVASVDGEIRPLRAGQLTSREEGRVELARLAARGWPVGE